MKLSGSKMSYLLFGGDIFFLILSLWLTLWLRYLTMPSWELLFKHLVPFSLVFIVWLAIFFIFDLYRKPTTLFRRELPALILKIQAVNMVIAVLFFYYVPIFGITPRTNLFIYLGLSFVLIVSWRLWARAYLGKGPRLNVIFACAGPEVEELKEELKHNPRYNLVLRDPEELPQLPQDRTLLIIFNPYSPKAPADRSFLYRLFVAGVTFVNVHDLYEEIFDRIPVAIIDEQWFLENISSRSTFIYDLFKRWLDLVVSLPASLISLLIYPVVALAIKLEDSGPIFYLDRRVGRGGKEFSIYKFRSMSNDGDLSCRRVTKVGRWLRKTRLDELPQLWNVLKGELSLIGPRPERPEYVELYRQEVPYYDTRHLITPGLSGWAQIYHDNHPHFSPATQATSEKLSYDLFYLKHRGPILDVIIGLKTIRILLLTKGA